MWSKVVCVRGAMSELVEARDFGGELYVSATNLVEALQRARESGAEHERIKLESMLTPRERRILRVREMCADAGVTVDQVMAKTGRMNVKLTHVRQDIWFALREDGMSLSEIGRMFKRDHTTILHGIKAAKERRDARGVSEEVRQAVEATV